MRFLLVALFIVVVSSSSFSQTTKQDSLRHTNGTDVIVTGFPAEQGKTPVPVTTIKREELQLGAPFKELPSLLKDLPSVVTYSESGLDIGYVYSNIRGFEQRRISVLINGIPQNDPEDHSVYWVDVPDLAGYGSKVNVQRGAGSAFYGSPAIGGSINVETFPPATKDFSFCAMGGTFGTTKFSASANSGLIDGKYLISAHFSQGHTDGYRDFAYIDTKSYFLSMARIDDNSTLQFNFYGGSITDGLAYYGITPGENNDRSSFTNLKARKYNVSEFYLYERRPEEQEQFVQPHYEVLSSIKLDEHLTLNNTIFYIQGDGNFDFDGTWPYLYGTDQKISNSVLYRLTSEYGLRYNFKPINDSTLGNELTRAYVGNKQWGWLPRLEYQHPDGMFILGGEVRIHRSTHWGKLLSASELPADLPGDYHYYDYKGGKDIISGYLSEIYSITPDANLSVSVQLLNEQYKLYDEKPYYLDSLASSLQRLQKGFYSNTFSVPLFFVNPRVGLNINLSNDLSSFASLSYTSREPRLKDYYNPEFISQPNFYRNANGSFNFNSPIIQPEHLIDIELGLKALNVKIDNDWHYSAAATAYYMPFTDELLQTGKKDQWGGSIVANAEKAVHYGLELEVGLEYSKLLALKATATISHNEVQKFSQYFETTSVDGKVPIGFPSATGNVSIVIQPLERLQCIVTGRYVGEMFGDLENTDFYRNDAYQVLDLGISYRLNNFWGTDHLVIRGQLNNALNTLYTSYVTKSAGFFVAATRSGYLSFELGI